MNHVMKLAEAPYRKIESGTKTMEPRLFDTKRRLIDLGDTLQFHLATDIDQCIKAEVVGLLAYPSFQELFADFSPSLFGADTKKDLLDELSTIYSKEDEEMHGVLGIKLKVIPS